NFPPRTCRGRRWRSCCADIIRRCVSSSWPIRGRRKASTTWWSGRSPETICWKGSSLLHLHRLLRGHPEQCVLDGRVELDFLDIHLREGRAVHRLLHGVGNHDPVDRFEVRELGLFGLLLPAAAAAPG